MSDDRKALDELMEALELDRLIRTGDIKLPEARPMEKLLEEVKETGKLLTRAGHVDGRRLAGKKRRKKNQSRKKKAAKMQRWRRSWKQRSLSKALEGEHYIYYEKRWREKKRPFTFSKEEWDKHVQPLISPGDVIELRRYDTSKPTSLDNLIIYSSTGEVVFDGAAWYMKEQGYCL